MIAAVFPGDVFLDHLAVEIQLTAEKECKGKVLGAFI